ncbi:aconitate hydratase, partial [candidate division KSB1 bacterium]|nr:aconitate hydratase [candidate division KSB1 bacterium]
VDESFAQRAKEAEIGFIVGGSNYGQGSSREHAALAPMYLGVKWVLSKSFARIHKANLINFGILPLEFKNENDFEKIEQGDKLVLENVISLLRESKDLTIKNLTKDITIPVNHDLTDRQRDIVLAGGLLNHTRENQ